MYYRTRHHFFSLTDPPHFILGIYIYFFYYYSTFILVLYKFSFPFLSVVIISKNIFVQERGGRVID